MSSDTVEQVKGVALVPKRAMDVMSGEVNRVLLLTKNAVVPLPYIVPRKVGRLLHRAAQGRQTATSCRAR